MSRHQSIENALKSINESVFQELCDSYLMSNYQNHTAFARPGSQTGKQKTTKGTPDTLITLPNGNFIFVEHTTNNSDTNKLAKDIKACFDPKKSKIPIEKIEEILLCFNWNIDQEKIDELNQLAKSHKADIKLRILMLQELALQLHLHHRDLVHKYLGLPLDTGQIVSIEQFIEEYDKASRGIATPLNNKFLHREKELKQIKNAIDKYDFIILNGAPGVGKTKSAIEAINTYKENNKSYQAYCVSYKSYDLLNDLYQYLSVDKNYILFVDDANRIDAIDQITGFFKASRKGNLKIIMTVRDYAYQEISRKCQEFLMKKIDLEKLTDEQITDIIKLKPFEILNPVYHRPILNIANGNPKLAIMCSLLAKQKQDIDSLKNVSELFENYFSTFIKGDDEFKNSLKSKCLGLIAFFYTIPYNNKEITKSILDKFDMSYTDFIDTIDKLDALELVEIRFDHVKISEQNLATFFFYKAFIKNDLLSFQTLLKYYFDDYKSRFTDTVIPANNSFDSGNVMLKLKPELVKYWEHIKNEESKSFAFLKTFWFYLQDQTLESAYCCIDSLPEVEDAEYQTDYDINQFSFDKDGIIELLGNFLNTNLASLKDAIDLLFEYAYRKPDSLPEVIHKIKESLTFDREDERYDFFRQKTLFNFLIKGVNNNKKLLSIAFFELSKTFLCYKFYQLKGGRNNTIISYQYPIPNTITIQKFRKKIWDTLKTNFTANPKEAFDLLNEYSKVHPDVNRDIMAFDIPYVVEIIKEKLNTEKFEHCKYVQGQIRWFRRHDFDLPEFETLKKTFVNEVYRTFTKIDWNQYRDKEMYEFEEYPAYDKLKEAEIRNGFIFKNTDEIDAFYDKFKMLKDSIATNNWNYEKSFDFIIDENASKDFKICLALLNKIISEGNEIKYMPGKIFINLLKTNQKAKQIWTLIQATDFEYKEAWELSFFDFIDDALINKKWTASLIKTIEKMKEPNYISFNRLERYQTWEPNLFQIILKSVTHKHDTQNVKIMLERNFFSKYIKHFSKNLELIKKAYIQQHSLQDFFDHHDKGLQEILKRDKDFLIELFNTIYSSSRRKNASSDFNDMGYVWNLKNIEETLIQIFDLVIEKGLHIGFSGHFCNVFFRNINEKQRADKFIIQYVVDNNRDVEKMQIIVDLIRHSKKELFEEILLLFISLNQDVEVFRKLLWNGNGGTYQGDTIIGDIKAAQWKNIQQIVNKSDVGIKLLPIKNHIQKQIQYAYEDAGRERQRKFLM